jgi:hypothetical protein
MFQKHDSLVRGDGIGSRGEMPLQPTYPTLTTFRTLSDHTAFLDDRYYALLALDQKFARMFLTSSLQQRILAN